MLVSINVYVYSCRCKFINTVGFYYRIDYINYFVHREMNLKNQTAHFFMKAEYG